ncbi:MAG: hypothetical protein D6791_14125 [Chloroflexi bacterium]|nr:MAG: hypothetical protein D6791_14125 [Chloroflexota bacterium]
MDVLSARQPATAEIAGWSKEHLREHIMRAVLIYARRRRGILHGLSDNQIRCLIEAITRRAERAVQKQVGKFDNGGRATTWIGAIAIREAMHAFEPSGKARPHGNTNGMSDQPDIPTLPASTWSEIYLC